MREYVNMEDNMEIIVRVATILLAAICNFILLERKIPAGYTYMWTVFGGNLLVILESFVVNGNFSPWFPIIHFFLTIFLFVGAVFGHFVWLGYILFKDIRNKD